MEFLRVEYSIHGRELRGIEPNLVKERRIDGVDGRRGAGDGRRHGLR